MYTSSAPLLSITSAEDDFVFADITDDALEKLALNVDGVANYTMFFCTALDLCPGP